MFCDVEWVFSRWGGRRRYGWLGFEGGLVGSEGGSNGVRVL